MNDRYRLRERLGTGGMSVVWRAHDEVLGRDVAVKVLAPGAGADPTISARIRLEARAAAGLRHPNIVEVYDFGEAGPDRPYVVMELVDGRTLDDVLGGQALDWPAAAGICGQVAAALAAAHARGVVHRDVKPGNVMVTEHAVKLVDFGISATAGEADETDGQVLGTPAYLAPERLDGGPVRPATDVYALGLLLYKTLAGRLPWSGSTVTQMVGNHLYAEPAPLPPVHGLPPEVADLCRRCLAKRPEDRPSAAQVAAVLTGAVPSGTVPAWSGALVAGTPTVAFAAPRRSARAAATMAGTHLLAAARRARRPRRAGSLVAAGAALATVVLGASFLRPPEGERPVRAEVGPVPSATATAPRTATSTTPAPPASTATTKSVSRGAPKRPAAKRPAAKRPAAEPVAPKPAAPGKVKAAKVKAGKGKPAKPGK
ncbi:serine/threonine-protein kinase [Actinoplanes friuliensis]|nr:serine/threonine-protein kinase [Actinoplanes friuliensis]